MASTPVYWFERKENRNWVKLAVGLIITKSGLATFEEQTVETLKNDQDPLGSSLVRDIGRKVRNASKFEVSDVEIKQCFENMRALFTAPQHLAVNATAHATVAQLNKLETEQMQVKRTDVMEAINFIDEQRFKDVENGESKALLIFHCAADKALAREIEVGLKSFGCFPIMMDITTMDRFGVHALQHLVDSCRILGLGLFIFTNETSDHFRNYAKKVIYGLPPDMSSLIILVLQSITKEELGIDESFTGKIFEYQDNNDFNIKSISLAITGDVSAVLIFHCSADKTLAHKIGVGLKSFGFVPIIMDITNMDRFGVHDLKHFVDSCRVLRFGLFIFTNETSNQFQKYANNAMVQLPRGLITLVLQNITKEELGINRAFPGKIFEYQGKNDVNIQNISSALKEKKSQTIFSWIQGLFPWSMTTHVANKYLYTIYAKCDFERVRVDTVIKDAIAGASAVGGSIDGGYEYSPRVSTIFTQAGFRKIIPDDLTAIQYDTTVIGTMYIWIYYVDENNIYHWLYSGLGRRPDCDVLVGPDGKIHYTKHGEIWIQK
ncbi:uncharacterized protein LOC128206421 isoform X1 [Mya arenaria]|uniref:uncharacterized protein LOC128206421 isoform X1 n=1 Tax=Mya arenaria TaxID=6604 RepID=UPI0022E77149|nr:uncharacterized protein LOC128206421 isoform X1 [Mya arenaria]XP_052764797.1 uncharacterized protein LOC128206421 isoform X1 [Mya arenaria]XP_052764798.1 uncharacterized protein LOC128206421 isoform X1 [Mya arenaria]